MYYSEPNIGRFEGFATPPNERMLEIVNDKYERFQRAGASMVRLETGWDDICATSTLSTMLTVVSPKAAELQQGLSSMYEPYARRALLTQSQSKAWRGIVLDSLVSERIEPILEAARANAGSVRDGARELYEHCKESGIPFIVKSASTRQVVEAASDAGGIKPDLIIATELFTNGKTPNTGTIIGWDFDTMTHSLNKGDVRPPELIAIEQAHPHVIGLGDGTLDRMMIHPQNDTFWIRANGGYQQHSEEWGTYLAESFAQLHIFDEKNPEFYTTYPPYDLVSIEPDLFAVNGLVREMFGSSA